MRRFFAEVNGNEAEINGEDAHHISNVLRLLAGDEIIICDGKGHDFITRIEYISSKKVVGNILESVPSAGEPNVKITLFQGLPKSDKLEYIIQKSVELGVYSIVPVEMKRSISKIDEKKKDLKLARWNKISASAAQQSGRGIIPKVFSPIPFDKAVNMAKEFDLALIAYEEEKEFTLKQALTKFPEALNIAVFIGPEGGIENSETEKLISCGAKSVTLGNRILRCETAPIAILSMIMYHFM